MNILQKLLTATLIVLCLGACSVNNLLPEGERLYNGAAVNIEHPDTVVIGDLKPALEEVLAPSRNARIFGFPWKVWFNLKFKTEKDKGLKHWLSTSIGEEPVYYDASISDQVVKLLTNRAQNLGFFRARADYEEQIKKKQVFVDYTVYTGYPYLIDSLHYAIQDSSVAQLIDSVSERTLILEGENYNVFTLRNERTRLQEVMRNNGYYYFVESDLEFLVDTSSTYYGVHLLEALKPDVQPNHLMPQNVAAINIYPDFRIGAETTYGPGDTLRFEGLNIICRECPLKPSALAEAFAFRPGQRYRPRRHQQTLQRLSNLNTFRYINLSYDPLANSDSLLVLNAYLTTRARRTIEGEVGVAFNTGQYFGPEISATYINRNLLRGAEYLQLDGLFSYNLYYGSDGESGIPYYGRYGLDAKVSVPRLWLPFREKILPNISVGNTVIGAGVQNERLRVGLNEYRNRIEELGLDNLLEEIAADSSYSPLVSFFNWEARYGYNWQRRQYLRHETNPLFLRYQSVQVETDQLLTLIRNLNVVESGQNATLLVEPMVLYSPDYTFLFDSRLRRPGRHNVFYQQRLAMNFGRTLPIEVGGMKPPAENTLYLQWETDLRYYLVMSNRQSIATRLHGNVAFPFSQRAIIPYSDLYSLGGPNSLRAFPPRGVGPGAANRDSIRNVLFAGFGNILLETSIEFRQNLAEMFEGAVFVDAGNVWEYKTTFPPKTTDFKFSNVFDQIAVDAGIGFRLNLDFLLFRLDLAWPVVKPWAPEGERLVIKNFFTDNWWWRELNLVLAFGYPF